MQALKNYIDGAWTASSSAERTEVMNPSTGEPIAWCPTSTAAEVDDAIAAARRAFPGWLGTPVTKRAATLFELRQRLADATPEIAKIMEEENGKSYSEGVGEMGRALEYVEHAATIPELLKGSISENGSGGVDTRFVREPLGVFAIVAPFNFPAMIPLYFSWAIACGNSVVVKPSELCPLTTIRFVELAEQCGFPSGVINVVLGGIPAVQQLASHPDVAGISFVGSSSAAEAVFKSASPESGGAAADFARRANVGQVGINIGTPAPIAFYPVGGRKASFFGTLRGRANDAVDFYTDKKVVVSTWHGR